MGDIYIHSELYANHKYNKENCLILSQVYDILAELKALDKKIILCKVPAHIGIKGVKKQE